MSCSNSNRSERLVKNSPSMVKALHDSCYVVPELNPRVIQDTDPVKKQAWQEAQVRHENSVKNQKHFNESLMKKHYEKIRGDDEAVASENNTRREKQKRFHEDIRTQMEQNVSAPPTALAVSVVGRARQALP